MSFATSEQDNVTIGLVGFDPESCGSCGPSHRRVEPRAPARKWEIKKLFEHFEILNLTSTSMSSGSSSYRKHSGHMLISIRTSQRSETQPSASCFFSPGS